MRGKRTIRTGENLLNALWATLEPHIEQLIGAAQTEHARKPLALAKAMRFASRDVQILLGIWQSFAEVMDSAATLANIPVYLKHRPLSLPKRITGLEWIRYHAEIPARGLRLSKSEWMFS